MLTITWQVGVCPVCQTGGIPLGLDNDDVAYDSERDSLFSPPILVNHTFEGNQCDGSGQWPQWIDPQPYHHYR